MFDAISVLLAMSSLALTYRAPLSFHLALICHALWIIFCMGEAY